LNRTAELRWFRREPFRGPVQLWFDEAAGPPETRSDRYLVLPGTDALGVKVRGGSTSFELKLRPRPGEQMGLPSGGSGQREEWQKWSFGRAGITRLLPRLGLPKARWVTVVKQRRMTAIAYRADAGCNVELTALEALSQSWATLGFEAFGPPADLLPALERAVATVFASVGDLDPDLSCGYPGWLATL
jgi:hypothetical protein